MLTSLTVERLKELKLDGMARALAKQLASSSQWIRDHLNVLIIDPTGVGKRFMACALGHKGCLECFRVSCTRAPRLFQELLVARGEGRYAKLMNTTAKTDLLIIDDWGLSLLTDQKQRDLLEIVEDRNGIHSTIIASQLPVKSWHESLGTENRLRIIQFLMQDEEAPLETLSSELRLLISSSCDCGR